MFNIKVNIIAAGAAFVLSFLLSILSGIPMPAIFIRPAIFSFAFFFLFAVIQILVNRFLPELFEKSGKEEGNELFPGSRIDISEGEPMSSPQDYSNELPPGQDPPVNKPAQTIVGARPNDVDKEMCDISDLKSFTRGESQEPQTDQRPDTDIDQTGKSDYTENGEVEEIPAFEPEKPESALEAAPRAAPNENKQAADSLPDFVFTNPVGMSTSDEVLPDLDSMAGAFSSSSAQDEPEASDFSVSMSISKPSSKQAQVEWAEEFPPKDIAMGIRTKMNKDEEA